MFKRYIAKELMAVTYSLAVTFAIGRWAINLAYIERGYDAVGGEYCLILITYLVASYAIHYLFHTLDDLEYERNRKKRKC